MKQMIRIIRRVDLEKQKYRTLLLDMEYQLGSLSVAMEKGDSEDHQKTLATLRTLHKEIQDLEKAHPELLTYKKLLK